ncbi:MAG TPA: TonB family protein [Terracidiphilus sp.]|nr:TonB family protein [Terracidiphilus sp.]
MFEDSTFESLGTIRTRSAKWMMATFTLNGAALLALVLIPLFYPEALPNITDIIRMEAPAPPVQEVRPISVPASSTQVRPQFTGITVPSVIPKITTYADGPEPSAPFDTSTWTSGQNLGAASPDNPFNKQNQPVVVQQKPQGLTRLSSGVMEGRIIRKVVPSYSALQRAMHMEGTVVLQAVISKTGTIENLRVISGPVMLQHSALDAVKQWRYQPYLLNGEPVEVETTVNVVFKLN